MTEWYKQFESIGDNCEFGIVQRHFGYDDGALLKWARVNDSYDLIRLLESNFSSFYQYENLEPAWDDMVKDKSNHILFHSELLSSETNNIRAFKEDDARRREIYAEESKKRAHLVNKFRNTLTNAEKIFVYKVNDTYNLDLAKRLHASLKKFNPNNILLYGSDLYPDKGGEIEIIEPGLIVGHVRRFAPYYPATRCNPQYWEEVCQKALALKAQKAA